MNPIDQLLKLSNRLADASDDPERGGWAVGALIALWTVVVGVGVTLFIGGCALLSMIHPLFAFAFAGGAIGWFVYFLVRRALHEDDPEPVKDRLQRPRMKD